MPVLSNCITCAVFVSESLKLRLLIVPNCWPTALVVFVIMIVILRFFCESQAFLECENFKNQ